MPVSAYLWRRTCVCMYILYMCVVQTFTPEEIRNKIRGKNSQNINIFSLFAFRLPKLNSHKCIRIRMNVKLLELWVLWCIFIWMSEVTAGMHVTYIKSQCEPMNERNVRSQITELSKTRKNSFAFRLNRWMNECEWLFFSVDEKWSKNINEST